MTSSEFSRAFWPALDGLLKVHPKGSPRQGVRARMVGYAPSTYSLRVHGRRASRSPDLLPMSRALLTLAPTLSVTLHLFSYQGRLHLLLYV